MCWSTSRSLCVASWFSSYWPLPPPLVQADSTSPMSVGATDMFQTLVTDLEPEGRYILLNAVANQLRFPNSHTNYFSQVILHLFCECADDALVLEQITRVLLERLVVCEVGYFGI